MNKKFRFNIIDLVIIALVGCAVAIFCIKFIGDGANDPGKTVRITCYEEECPDYVIENTKIGDPVYNSTDEVNIGNVVDVRTAPSVSYIETETDEIIAGSKDGYSALFITTEMKNATVSPHGVVVGDVILAPGHTLVIYAGGGKYFMTVQAVEVMD